MSLKISPLKVWFDIHRCRRARACLCYSFCFFLFFLHVMLTRLAWCLLDWNEKDLDPEISGNSERLWEEKWDDDDADDDFAAQLK